MRRVIFRKFPQFAAVPLCHLSLYGHSQQEGQQLRALEAEEAGGRGEREEREGGREVRSADRVAMDGNRAVRHLDPYEASFARTAVLVAFGATCKFVTNFLNKTHIRGIEHFTNAYAAQGPLLTVSNHTSAVDDPAVVLSLLNVSDLADSKRMRWTLCAHDRCFSSGVKALNEFFHAAKVIPVVRGKGLRQDGMEFAKHKLENGDWVHIFPEGTRSRDGSLGAIRSGVGMLVAESKVLPTVIPIYHAGMENLLGVGAVLPSVLEHVHVVVGEPIPLDDLFTNSAALQAQNPETKGVSSLFLNSKVDGEVLKEELYRKVADRIGETMWRLRQVTLKWRAEQLAEMERLPNYAETMADMGMFENPVWTATKFVDEKPDEKKFRLAKLIRNVSRKDLLAEAVNDEEKKWLVRHWTESDRLRKIWREKKERMRDRQLLWYQRLLSKWHSVMPMKKSS
ncbi:mitochondrial tafazzin (phospholipid lysophospholipid transacylase) [Andalucia godoyi]|uniref:Tafazzin family protein n=1 Tax=Andalucia godoyi TaxID=505711 RepID=A0A8K0F4A0_ANDGO|nr:mitochondrial tafazzin (phospholipid lysophospholipid transacylase) [Andalucia godoyi]|eukprot:ANDGO_03474.mRNA.1 mitochondrial tafazzin (phospholipid lysophospholipid transacylase)